ncbi:MAG: sodium:solute symporter family protein, partial [Cyclonatronaceae bacterium]
MAFTVLDWIPLLLYFGLLMVFSLRKKYRARAGDDELSYLLSGRRMSLPAFVLTLVATWYGGILGVGEFTYQAGIAQWFLFGLPYYLFAALFTVFLAGKIRAGNALTIPEALETAYGPKPAIAGALGVFLLVSPAPYILMLGVLAQVVTGSDSYLWYGVGIAIFSAFYVGLGGFSAVVRTDALQLVLMYGGFMMLAGVAWQHFGSPAELWKTLPDTHADPSGGFSPGYVLAWVFIAMWTFVDPGFHQRAAAAKTPETARRGIFISIGCWFVFDMLTLLSGLYAFAILGEHLAQPVAAFPALAAELLPVGFLGLFITALVAVIMSTLDSFLFLSGQTLGRDVLKRYAHYFGSGVSGRDAISLTRAGIAAATLLAIALIWAFPSVIELWYVLGSLVIPALLLPVLGAYLPFFRMDGRVCFFAICAGFTASLGWLLM